ncbi:MAG: B12-binding domain-containing radical SAM protein, partial [Kiritimatiellia bacterium]
MADFSRCFDENAQRMQQAQLFLPRPDPAYDDPKLEEAGLRVLIVRLSSYRDVESSLTHLFLFDAVRRAEPRAYVDFVFFPPRHDRRLLLENGIPLLTGIQSAHSAEDFDLVLVSNSFVLEMLNLPYLLRHSRWPLFAADRHSGYPPVVLGGANAGAARCLAPFVNGIFRGEGEEAIGEIIRRRGQVPTTSCVTLCRPSTAVLPLNYPILNGKEAGTARVQIAYGCPLACAFCFEGFEHRPYREIAADELIAHVARLKAQVGCEEIELLSFNFNVHTEIARLIVELSRMFERVSFKSQRLDVLASTPWLLPLEIAAGKRSFTLGIEGISERLRSFLNKGIVRQDIETALCILLREHIRKVKLFYVLTEYETADDHSEFQEFCSWLCRLRESQERAVRIIFSFGLLLRMPGTPLEHDRLFLLEEEWTPIIKMVESTCRSHGFEFRLASAWPESAASQVLALADESIAPQV